MKKTMKKAMALILATLMLALATPFAMMNVAADEATSEKIGIVNFSAFGYHLEGDSQKSLHFYASYPSAFAYDGDIASDAQILNNDGVGNLPYEMCYFDENGNMKNGTNESGKSYYLMFIIELSAISKIDTLSLWTTYAYAGNADEPFMANNGYDIYYSEDGTSYSAVEDATFSNVYTEVATNGLYKAGTYNGKDGYVHEINMKGVKAEFIAIAVSELVYGADEAIVSEVVLMGQEVEESEEENIDNGSQSSQDKTEDTKAATDTQADTSATTEKKDTVAAEEKGCGGVIGGVSSALVGALAVGVVLKSRKKKEN